MHRYWDRLQRYPSENVNRRRGSSLMADARRQRTRRRSSPPLEKRQQAKTLLGSRVLEFVKTSPCCHSNPSNSLQVGCQQGPAEALAVKRTCPTPLIPLGKRRTDERRPKLTSLVSSLLQALAGTVLPMFETCQLAPNGRSQAETRAVDIQSWAVSDFHDNLPVQRKG